MLIVMAVAFVGAALSEWFHRREMPVLSEPLQRTALALPLVPAIGFWFVNYTARRPGSSATPARPCGS